MSCEKRPEEAEQADGSRARGKEGETERGRDEERERSISKLQ